MRISLADLGKKSFEGDETWRRDFIFQREPGKRSHGLSSIRLSAEMQNMHSYSPVDNVGVGTESLQDMNRPIPLLLVPGFDTDVERTINIV